MPSAEEVLAHYKSEWETKIRNMEPGPELDSLVAEKVMGWTYGHPCPEGMDCLHWVDEKGKVCDYKPPQYSTDIAAAWEVVGKLQNDYVLDFKLERKYCVAAMKFVAVFEDLDGKKWVAHGWIAPEAICKAALLAVMDNETN